jgi:hypothetical protein
MQPLSGDGMNRSGYSFVDATFFFFKAFGRRPLGVLWIALWQVIVYSAIFAAVAWLMWPIFSLVIEAAANGQEPDERMILQSAGSILGASLVSFFGFIIAALMVQGAWIRLLTRDEVAAVIPLRFGADELRLLLVNLVFIAFGVLAYIAIFIVAGVIVAAAALGADGGGAGLAAGIGLLVFVLVVAGIVAAIILAIRFAAAPAMSVNERGFRLFASFDATRGVAGAMFLSYLTLIALALGGAIIVSIFQQIAVLLVAADLFPTLMALENTDDPQVVLQVLSELVSRPSVIVGLFVVVVLQIMLQVVIDGSWHGVGAYAAVRHAGGELAPGEAEIETPSASVGDAPRQG